MSAIVARTSPKFSFGPALSSTTRMRVNAYTKANNKHDNTQSTNTYNLNKTITQINKCVRVPTRAGTDRDQSQERPSV